MDARISTGDGLANGLSDGSRELVTPAWRPAPSLQHVVLAADAVALAGAAVVAAARDSSEWLVWAYAGLAFLALHVFAPRRGRLEAAATNDLGWILQRLGLPLLVLVPVSGSGAFHLSVPVAASVVATVVGRFVVFRLLRRARSRGVVSEPCLIVGAGDTGRRLAAVLLEHREFGLAPAGFLDGPRAIEPAIEPPLPVLGGCADLDRITRDLGIRTVLIADGERMDHDLVRAIRSDVDRRLELYVVPRLADAGAVPREAECLWGVHLIHLDRSIFRRVSRAGKRAFDVAVASTAIVLLSPALLVAALATRVSSPGPILFRQKRVGLNGAVFEMLKFRTMEVSDDPDTTWSVTEDDRVTKVGRALRRSSVDELPQLFNVVRGEMSIVGPRPERPHFVDSFTVSAPGYADRHRVAGGMTGLAQIHGRSRSLDAIPERARFDNDYIDNWSMWGDVAIVGRTARLLFRGDHDEEAATSPPVDGEVGRVRGRRRFRRVKRVAV